MKHLNLKTPLTLLVSILLAIPVYVQALDFGEWTSNVKQAKTLALQTNRPIFVVANSFNCTHCDNLNDKALETDAFKAFARKNQIVLFRTDDSLIELSMAITNTYASMCHYGSVSPHIFLFHVKSTANLNNASSTAFSKSEVDLAKVTWATSETPYCGKQFLSNTSVFGISLGREDYWNSTIVGNLLAKFFPNDYWNSPLQYPDITNLDKEDENLTLYHNKTDDTSSKIDRILADDTILVKLCTGGKYDEVTEYQLLLRVLNEQTVLQEDGSYRLKEAGDPTMTGSILQNPSDPEATFRTKAGKEHRGYVANLVEEKGEDSSLVTDYQVEQNIHSDSEFMDEYIDNIGQQDEKVTVVADGAYSGKAQEEHAGENNVEIFTTNLTGKEAKDIAADFEFNEDGTRVTRCPNGKEPKSCSCSKAGICTVSFHKSDCENCPYRDQCQPKEYARTNHVTISARAKERAEKQRSRKTEEFKKMSAFRNGVEAVPSFLRRLFDVDRMPVRGKGRVSFFFGCMVGALNVRKFCNCMLGRDRSAQMATIG